MSHRPASTRRLHVAEHLDRPLCTADVNGVVAVSHVTGRHDVGTVTWYCTFINNVNKITRDSCPSVSKQPSFSSLLDDF